MCLSVSPDSKNLKKGVQSGPKFKCGTGTQKGHLALLECRLAQIQASAQEHLDWDKTHHFFIF